MHCPNIAYPLVLSPVLIFWVWLQEKLCIIPSYINPSLIGYIFIHKNLKASLIIQWMNHMMVSVNGPELPHFDSIVENALQLMQSKFKNVNDRLEDPFIRRSLNIEPYMNSKAVDNFKRTLKNCPFLVYFIVPFHCF